MRNLAAVTVLLFLSAPAIWAQAGDPGADQVRGSANRLNVISGCLQRSGFQYTLTDNTGKSTMLTGNTGKLKHDVGHQVELTGKPTIKTIDTTETQAASTVQEIPVFQVKTAKSLSSACTPAKQH